MTDYQKEQIPVLRSGGMGYKAIANVLGLSRDIVRGFCKKNGLEGNASVIQENIALRVKNRILCANCEKALTQPSVGRRRRFCSDECRRSWWKANPDKQTKSESAIYKEVCAYCKTPFESYGFKGRKYCCHECYIKDRFGGTNNGI